MRFHRGVLRPPYGCFVLCDAFGVVGAKPLPLGEPRVLIRSVKTHKGLLLTKVTKPCIMDSIERKIGEVEQEKEAIVAEVEPLRELKTGIDEIDTTGTKLPFGVVAIKKKDLEAVKEQAKAYTANRDEIGELRERSAAVSRREQRADRGFWGMLAETTGRETQVSCSVGVDGIAQKIQKSRAVRGGDLR